MLSHLLLLENSHAQVQRDTVNIDGLEAECGEGLMTSHPEISQ